MTINESLYSKALLQSLSQAPLLVGDLPEARSWKESLDSDFADVILNFDQKLGHLYEDALECLISRSQSFELLAKNLQVSDATGRTLGEMDFLVRNRESGECFQLELAVKFYLSVFLADGSEVHPGPDPRDNWVNKLARMRERQLRLSETPEAKRLLLDRFEISQLSVAQRIYGIIFDPMFEDRLSRPPSVCAQARRAKWLYASEFERAYAEKTKVKVVPKCLWPVLMNAEIIDSLEEVPIEKVLIEVGDRCVLFWDEQREEVVFIVADKWPIVG